MTAYTPHSIPVLVPAGTLTEPGPPRSAVRKKASTACSACRARRSKCTGSVPCLACLSHGTECIKDENEDGRRRVAIKRRLEGLDKDRQALVALIDALRIGSDAQIGAIVNQVRKNTSRDDLSAFLDEMMAGQLTTGEESIQLYQMNSRSPEAVATRRRPRTGGIGDLINPPIQVPAKPWTNVIDDDEYVSHLISLWFTWIHPCFRWVEDQSFIEAMQSKDIDSPLCAPYLVNSILAQASLLDISSPNEDNYHARLRAKFLAEAKAGIEAEKGVASLTMVQAVGVQWTDLYLNGQDRQGRIIQNTQIFLSKDLAKWRNKLNTQHGILPETLRRVDRCLHYMEWVQYGSNAFNLADFYTFQSLVDCKSSKPGYSHDAGLQFTWFAYPLNRHSQTEFHPDCYFDNFLYLAKVITENENLSAKRAQGDPETSEKVLDLLHDLWSWPDRVFSCMRLHPQAMPQILILYALYHWVILVIAKQASAADAGRPKEPVITKSPVSQDGVRWQNLAIEQALKIAEIMQWYTRQWGRDYFPAMIMQPLSLAMLVLLGDLEPEANRNAFVALSKTLRAVSRKFRVATGIQQVIVNTANDQDIKLPPEAEFTFGQSDVRMLDRESSSEDSAKRTEGGAPEVDITVDYLLEKWDDLDLDTEETGLN